MIGSKKLHIIFCKESETDVNRIIESLRNFNAGVELMICSNSQSTEDLFRAKTGSIYTYHNGLQLDPRELEINQSLLSIAIDDRLTEGYEVSFNITCASSIECHLAFSLALIYKDCFVYAIDETDNLVDLTISTPITSEKLRTSSKILLYEIKQKDGLLFQEISIPHKQKTLGRKGINNALNELQSLGLIYHEEQRQPGSGRNPYIWKLTESGNRYYGEHVAELRALRMGL